MLPPETLRLMAENLTLNANLHQRLSEKASSPTEASILSRGADKYRKLAADCRMEAERANPWQSH